MKPQLVSKLPDGEEWVYEVKWDGFRALILKGASLDLVSRNNKSLASEFPDLLGGLDKIPPGTVIDGEIVALDEEGRPAFQELQNRGTTSATIVFYAFDLLKLEGADLTGQRFTTRRSALEKLVKGTSLRLSHELKGAASEVMAAIQKLGLEGAVAKHRDSLYVSGDKLATWQKVRIARGQELVIGGWKPGLNSFESILVGYFEGRKLMYASKVRAGFTPMTRRAVWELIKDEEVEKCPFSNLPDATKKGRWGEGITAEDMKTLRWVKPKRVVEISFVEWTSAGHLRHSSFKGIRTDKEAKKVVRESPS